MHFCSAPEAGNINVLSITGNVKDHDISVRWTYISDRLHDKATHSLHMTDRTDINNSWEFVDVDVDQSSGQNGNIIIIPHTGQQPGHAQYAFVFSVRLLPGHSR